jgi:hypothetical protein
LQSALRVVKQVHAVSAPWLAMVMGGAIHVDHQLDGFEFANAVNKLLVGGEFNVLFCHGIDPSFLLPYAATSPALARPWHGLLPQIQPEPKGDLPDRSVCTTSSRLHRALVPGEARWQRINTGHLSILIPWISSTTKRLCDQAGWSA